MFSARTRWDRSFNRLARLAAERRGRELLDLTQSNPTRVGLLCPAETLASLGDARNRRYEPDPRGLATARAAVAADYVRRGCPLDAERILLTASTSEAYAHLFKLLCDPGDAVLVPRPSYPLFEYLARLESVEPVPYPLAYDGEWHLLPSAVAAAATARTRAVVVVNPNNPTGSYLKRDERDPLLAFCAERGLALISDEVFADYAFGPDPGRVPSLASDGPALTFALGGLSKSCALPQLKLGWIAVAGPEPLRREATARLELVADTYLSVATPVQLAAATLLERLPQLQRPVAERIGANMRRLRAQFSSGSAVSLLDAEGGWSAVLRVPATESEEDWVAGLLEHDGVLVHPGYFYDFAAEAYLVLSLLVEPERFDAAVLRIDRRVAEGLPRGR